MPETYTCYLVLTDQSLHYLHYDGNENCLHHLALTRQQIQSIDVKVVKDLPLIKKLWRLNQTSYNGAGVYSLALKLAGRKQVEILYKDSMYLHDNLNTPDGYIRAVQAQAMAQYFHQQMIKIFNASSL